MSCTPPHSSRASSSIRRFSTIVRSPCASMRNSSSPISASSRPSSRSISSGVEMSRTERWDPGATRSMVQVFSRMMGGAARRVILMSVSASSVGFSTVISSMIATSFCAEAKLTRRNARCCSDTTAGFRVLVRCFEVVVIVWQFSPHKLVLRRTLDRTASRTRVPDCTVTIWKRGRDCETSAFNTLGGSRSMERSGTWLATAATPPQVNPRAWLVLASLLTSPHRLLFAIHTVYMEKPGQEIA